VGEEEGGAGGGAARLAAAGGGKVSGPGWPHPPSSKLLAHNEPAAIVATRRDATLDCCFNMPRILLAMNAGSVPTPLTDAEFHERSDALLSAIEATVDRWLQSDVVDIDARRSGGLLEMTLPNGSHLIVNTQPPLHELWLAARSGGFHYKWTGASWSDTRDGSEFLETLSRCASEQTGLDLRFDAAGA